MIIYICIYVYMYKYDKMVFYETHATMVVLQLPPRLSLSRKVSLLSL